MCLKRALIVVTTTTIEKDVLERTLIVVTTTTIEKMCHNKGNIGIFLNFKKGVIMTIELHKFDYFAQ